MGQKYNEVLKLADEIGVSAAAPPPLTSIPTGVMTQTGRQPDNLLPP